MQTGHAKQPRQDAIWFLDSKIILTQCTPRGAHILLVRVKAQTLAICTSLEGTTDSLRVRDDEGKAIGASAPAKRIAAAVDRVLGHLSLFVQLILGPAIDAGEEGGRAQEGQQGSQYKCHLLEGESLVFLKVLFVQSINAAGSAEVKHLLYVLQALGRRDELQRQRPKGHPTNCFYF